MPLLTEYNLNEVCKYDTPLALQAPKFCLDAAAIPRLSDGRVVTVDRRREPTRPWHEYLILCVVDINGSPDIWIRYERGRNLEDIPWTWKAISIAPALDSVRISCDCNKLRKSGNETIAFLQCGSGLRLRHTFELLSIIEQESRNWSIIGQNCWWYCAVNMDLYQKKFGGNWILEPKPPKKDVRKMIHSVLGDVVEVTTRVSKRYLGDANPASREIDVQRFLRLSMGKSPSTYSTPTRSRGSASPSPMFQFNPGSLPDSRSLKTPSRPGTGSSTSSVASSPFQNTFSNTTSSRRPNTGSSVGSALSMPFPSSYSDIHPEKQRGRSATNDTRPRYAESPLSDEPDDLFAYLALATGDTVLPSKRSEGTSSTGLRHSAPTEDPKGHIVARMQSLVRVASKGHSAKSKRKDESSPWERTKERFKRESSPRGAFLTPPKESNSVRHEAVHRQPTSSSDRFSTFHKDLRQSLPRTPPPSPGARILSISKLLHSPPRPKTKLRHSTSVTEPKTPAVLSRSNSLATSSSHHHEVQHVEPKYQSTAHSESYVLPTLYLVHCVCSFFVGPTTYYLNLPFLDLRVGDVCEVLAEGADPSTMDDLPIEVAEDEEDCMLVCKESSGKVGWCLASYVSPLEPGIAI